MQADIVDPFYFIDIDAQVIANKTIEQIIPPQMVLGSSAEALASAANGTKGASNVAVIINFFINLMLAGTMSLLWGLVNSL